MVGIDPREALAALDPDGLPEWHSVVARYMLARIGISDESAGLPEWMGPILAPLEALPHWVSERLRNELMTRPVEPREP